MSNNSWKQYGGVEKINSFNVISSSIIIAEEFVSKNTNPGKEIFNGSLEVTVDLIAGRNAVAQNDMIVSNSISAIKDLYINRDLYIDNKLYFFSLNPTAYISTVQLDSVLPLDTSHAYITGDFYNIGVNVKEPKTAFHISCDNSSTSHILTVNSNNDYIRNVVAKNKNKKGIVTDANNDESKIMFFNDTSTNSLNSQDGLVRYASGGYLTLATTNEIKERSRKTFFNTSGGSFTMDNSGIVLQSNESIFIDSSSGFLLDTSQGFINFDSSLGSLSL